MAHKKQSRSAALLATTIMLSFTRYNFTIWAHWEMQKLPWIILYEFFFHFSVGFFGKWIWLYENFRVENSRKIGFSCTLLSFWLHPKLERQKILNFFLDVKISIFMYLCGLGRLKSERVKRKFFIFIFTLRYSEEL
jgi:hypothetical protein